MPLVNCADSTPPLLLRHVSNYPHRTTPICVSIHPPFTLFPLPFTGRIAIKDVTISGTLIRAGEGVIAAAQSGNRDEDVFTNPDSFDIHRVFTPVAKSLAYGHGVHQCVAEHLAMRELEIALNTLFKELPKLRLAVDDKDVKYSDAAADVGILELPVSWD
jgi:fungal nitric oxide reductase